MYGHFAEKILRIFLVLLAPANHAFCIGREGFKEIKPCALTPSCFSQLKSDIPILPPLGAGDTVHPSVLATDAQKWVLAVVQGGK